MSLPISFLLITGIKMVKNYKIIKKECKKDRNKMYNPQ